MTTYRDRHLAGLHDADPDKRAKAEAKLAANEKKNSASAKKSEKA